MRILLVCERLGERDDEGIKNVARALLAELSVRHEVRAFTRGRWPGREDVERLPMNRFFMNARSMPYPQPDPSTSSGNRVRASRSRRSVRTLSST